MSLKSEVLNVIIHDDYLEVTTSKGGARYEGYFLTTHKGDRESLPGALIVTDARSIKPAVNVTAESALWGVDVKWQWPKEADDKWRAEIKAEYSNGEVTTYQGRNILFPDCTYQVTDVPAGKDISLTVTLNDGNGKRSKPVQLSAKSSDNASAILCNAFKIIGGQALINDAFMNAGNISHVASISIGVNSNKAEATADKVREIVSKYLYGQASEYEDELVDELKSFIEKESDNTRLATIISEQVRQRLNKELQPGGLLYKR